MENGKELRRLFPFESLEWRRVTKQGEAKARRDTPRIVWPWFHRVWPDSRADFGGLHRWDGARRQWVDGSLQLR